MKNNSGLPQYSLFVWNEVELYKREPYSITLVQVSGPWSKVIKLEISLQSQISSTVLVYVDYGKTIVILSLFYSVSIFDLNMYLNINHLFLLNWYTFKIEQRFELRGCSEVLELLVLTSPRTEICCFCFWIVSVKIWDHDKDIESSEKNMSVALNYLEYTHMF